MDTWLEGEAAPSLEGWCIKGGGGGGGTGALLLAVEVVE